jgi:hypothetical protein
MVIPGLRGYAEYLDFIDRFPDIIIILIKKGTLRRCFHGKEESRSELNRNDETILQKGSPL